MKRFTAFMRKPPTEDNAKKATAGARSDETKQPTGQNEDSELAGTLGKLSLTAKHASSPKAPGDDLDAQLGRLKLSGPLKKPTIPPHLVPLPPSPDLEEREALVWPTPPAFASSSSSPIRVKQQLLENVVPAQEQKLLPARRTPKKKQSGSAAPGGAAKDREAAASPVASTSGPKPSRASPRLKERLASPTPPASRLAHDFSDSSAEEDAEGDTDDEYFPGSTIPSTGGRRSSKDVEVITSTDAHQRTRRERMESPVPLSPPSAAQAPPSPPPEARQSSPTLLRARQQPPASTQSPSTRSSAPPPPSAARASPAPALVPRMRAPALARSSEEEPSPPPAPTPASPPPPPALARSFAPPPPARRTLASTLAAPPPPPSAPAPASALSPPAARSRGSSPFALFGASPTGRSGRRAGAGGFGDSAGGGAIPGMPPSGSTFGARARMSSPPFEGSYSQPYSQAPAFASYGAPPPRLYHAGEPSSSFTSLEETYTRLDRSTPSPDSDLFGHTDNVGDESFDQSTMGDFGALLDEESASATTFGTMETLSAEEATYLDSLAHPIADDSHDPAAPVVSDGSFAEEQTNSLASSYDFAETWMQPRASSTSTSLLPTSDHFVPSPPEGSFISPATTDSRSPSFPAYPESTLPSSSSVISFPFSASSSSLSKNLADATDEELQTELARRKLERELAQIAALSPPMDNTVNPAHLQLPSPPTIYDNQPYDSTAIDPSLTNDILVLPPLPDIDAVYPSITSSQRSSTPNARPFTHQSRASRPTPLSRPAASTFSASSSKPQGRDLLDCYEYIPSGTNPARGQYVCRICKDRPLEPGKKRKMGEYSGTRGAPSSIATRAWGHWDKYHGGL